MAQATDSQLARRTAAKSKPNKKELKSGKKELFRDDDDSNEADDEKNGEPCSKRVKTKQVATPSPKPVKHAPIETPAKTTKPKPRRKAEPAATPPLKRSDTEESDLEKAVKDRECT